MRKKTLFQFLTLVLAISLVLVGCSGNNNSGSSNNAANSNNGGNAPAASDNSGGSGGEQVTISFWNPFSGGDGEFMKTMIAQFHKDNPNIKVEDLTTESGDYYTRLQTAMAADEAPDVAVVHAARMAEYVTAEQLTDLTDLAAANNLNWDDFNSNILASTVFDGKNMSIPLDSHGYLMFYNKKYLKDAGVLGTDGKPVIEPGTDGFTAFLQKIKSAVPADVAPLAQPNVRIDGLWMFWGFYNQINGGGKIYNDDQTKGAINNPEALKALDYMNSLYTSKLIPPNIDDAFGMFRQGKAAIITTGTWGTGAFESEAGIDLGVVPMPKLFDQDGAWADSHTLALPKHSKEDPAKQKAAFTFANYISHHAEEWAKAGHIPAVKSVTESDAFKAMNHRSGYINAADSFKFWPKHVQQGAVNKIMEDEIVKMMQGQQSPADTLKSIDKQIDETLSN